MSLFQCGQCGCLENSSLTGAYWSKPLLEDHPEAIKSYMETLGLKDFAQWGHYCSACNPIWYDEHGEYGVGPRPADYNINPDKYKDQGGIWHGKFERMFLPKGLFETNFDGNLAHIETLDTDVDKYALPEEEEIELLPNMPQLGGRLPRPSETAECKRYLEVIASMKSAPEHLQPRDEPTRRAMLRVLAYQAISAREELERLEERKEERRRLRARGPRGFGAAAALTAMAALSGPSYGMPQVREAPRPRQKTAEDLEAERKRSAAKLAAAEEKRRRKAEKRRKTSGAKVE